VFLPQRRLQMGRVLRNTADVPYRGQEEIGLAAIRWQARDEVEYLG
jgi:hypothetical protein